MLGLCLGASVLTGPAKPPVTIILGAFRRAKACCFHGVDPEAVPRGLKRATAGLFWGRAREPARPRNEMLNVSRIWTQRPPGPLLGGTRRSPEASKRLQEASRVLQEPKGSHELSRRTTEAFGAHHGPPRQPQELSQRPPRELKRPPRAVQEHSRGRQERS